MKLKNQPEVIIMATSSLTISFVLNKKQTKKLFEYQQQQTKPTTYQKNDRLKEGRELLIQLSSLYNR